MHFVFFLLAVLLFQKESVARLSQCKAELKNDTPVWENSKIKRTFLWNQGALQHFSLFNKIKNQLINGIIAPGTRETKSIVDLKNIGIEGSYVQFAPDATFYINIQNKPKADQFLKEHQLETKKFICAIPRLRYTPYHQFNPNKNGWNEAKIKQVEETNAKYREADHAKLREAMIAWVRETGNKVLVCPEMTYQVDIMDELLINPLPVDVKPFIVKHGYWLPEDEAASVYAMAHTVLSFECHSPIIAEANGTPCFYLRQPEDTIKGQMYYDLNLNDWTFEIDQTDGKQIADRLREVWKDYPAAKAKLAKSMKKVQQIYKDRTDGVRTYLT